MEKEKDRELQRKANLEDWLGILGMIVFVFVSLTIAVIVQPIVSPYMHLLPSFIIKEDDVGDVNAEIGVLAFWVVLGLCSVYFLAKIMIAFKTGRIMGFVFLVLIAVLVFIANLPLEKQGVAKNIVLMFLSGIIGYISVVFFWKGRRNGHWKRKLKSPLIISCILALGSVVAHIVPEGLNFKFESFMILTFAIPLVFFVKISLGTLGAGLDLCCILWSVTKTGEGTWYWGDFFLFLGEKLETSVSPIVEWVTVLFTLLFATSNWIRKEPWTEWLSESLKSE